MTIERYVLVDRDSTEHDVDVEYDSYDEAVQAAGSDHAVIARQYELVDSELVWTPNGEMVWPPDDYLDDELEALP